MTSATIRQARGASRGEWLIWAQRATVHLKVLERRFGGRWSGEASQGATADLAVSQPYSMAVAGRGQLVVPGIPRFLGRSLPDGGARADQRPCAIPPASFGDGRVSHYHGRL